MKYTRWLDKNIADLTGKTVLVLGATGGIGRWASIHLAYRHAKVILGGRNEADLTAIRDEILSMGEKAEIQKVDYLDRETADQLISYIREHEIDCIVNNIGIYHQKQEMIGGLEKMILVNLVMPMYIFENLKEHIKEKKIRLVNVGSISYSYAKIDEKDIQRLAEKNKTRRYAHTKRILMSYCQSLRKEGIDSRIVHPGIATTNLFARKNKAYPGIFYVLVVPLMKLLFMGGEKASLTIVKGVANDKIDDGYWIGPRGFLHCWGYPNVQRLKKELYGEESVLRIKEALLSSLDKENQNDR